jgi:hypothetical protein
MRRRLKPRPRARIRLIIDPLELYARPLVERKMKSPRERALLFFEYFCLGIHKRPSVLFRSRHHHDRQ